MSTQKVSELQRGTLVVAVRDLDPEGANVVFGELGVVFQPTDYYHDNAGPMVRWLGGGACNVYEGDVVGAPTK